MTQKGLISRKNTNNKKQQPIYTNGLVDAFHCNRYQCGNPCGLSWIMHFLYSCILVFICACTVMFKHSRVYQINFLYELLVYFYRYICFRVNVCIHNNVLICAFSYQQRKINSLFSLKPLSFVFPVLNTNLHLFRQSDEEGKINGRRSKKREKKRELDVRLVSTYQSLAISLK